MPNPQTPEERIRQIWLEIADEVGNEVAPKQPNGSKERQVFLMVQALMYAKLLLRLVGLINDARIDEVKNIPIHENSDGSIVDQLMPVYQVARLAALRTTTERKES